MAWHITPSSQEGYKAKIRKGKEPIRPLLKGPCRAGKEGVTSLISGRASEWEKENNGGRRGEGKKSSNADPLGGGRPGFRRLASFRSREGVKTGFSKEGGQAVLPTSIHLEFPPTGGGGEKLDKKRNLLPWRINREICRPPQLPYAKLDKRDTPPKQVKRI